MNLNDLVDSNTTTRKMRSVLKRDNVKKEVGQLSKRKNSNPDERNCQPMDGPSTHEDDMNVDGSTIADE